ncbi:hypothetical protein DPMN_128422 [Dreissena polymorpha]|uniref:Uncharacterized protein n=1 Tax=Dreissena polymorpha TaxID=45954 RepID=A0A9D4GZG1_DREPO|nr:hypothetical protein DPMN_128422 [Dreissena polymorpha]
MEKHWCIHFRWGISTAWFSHVSLTMTNLYMTSTGFCTPSVSPCSWKCSIHRLRS